jgi:methionine-rich copper-binding protein CopC
MRRLLTSTAAACLTLLMLTGSVVAHAELVSSTPTAGEVLTTAPTEVVLTFDEATVGNSSFDVVDAGGTTVATGGPDPADPTIMRATLPPLEPGVYEVQWTSVAEDKDVEHGTFTFTIAEPTEPPATPTPAPTDQPSPSAPATLTPGPTASPAPSGSGDVTSGSGSEALIPIAVVALLIGGGLVYFVRRRGPV